MTPDLWILISFLIFIGFILFTSIRKKVLNFLDNKINSINKELNDSAVMRKSTKDDLEEARLQFAAFEIKSKEIVEFTDRRIDEMRLEASIKIENLQKKRALILEQAIQQYKNQETLRLKKEILVSAITEVETILKNNPNTVNNFAIYEDNNSIIKNMN